MTRSIRTFTAFSSCPDEVLQRLEEASTRRQLADGELLFREGDPSRFLFAVESGGLRATKTSPDGHEVHLRELAPGDIGGLTSIMSGKPRSATLQAATSSSVLEVDRLAVLAALEEFPALGRALVAYLADRVREKSKRLATFTSAGHDPRTLVAVFDAKKYDEPGLEEAGPEGVGFHYFEPRLTEQTVSLAYGHSIVCAFVNDELTAPVLRRLRDLGVELLAMRCAGYNNVDLPVARECGIDVVRVPAYSPYAVAEHAVALILTLNRKTHRAYVRVREGNFSLHGLVGFDLHGKTAGIIGLGQIGVCLAKILLGFGMTVVANDDYASEERFRELGVERLGLEALLDRADVVSLHAPLVPETHHLMNEERLARMKPGSMLINTSRGALVDAAALIGVLKSGHLGSAGLDVYEEESEYFFEDRSDGLISDDLLARLMTFNNVLITSHQAFLTEDALRNIAQTTVDSIEEWRQGKRGGELTHAVLV